jgi:GT2 family glycosyltransferase
MFVGYFGHQESRSESSGSGIGVVIVHYGATELTSRSVGSVLDDPSSCDRQIVVVDNGGDLEASQGINGARVVPSADNPGYGTGLNRGVRALRDSGDLRGYLCLNNDVTLGSGFLDAAHRALGDTDVGAVGGPTYEDPERSRLWYAGGSVNFALGSVRQERTASAAETAREVGFIPGAAIVINSRAWDEVGGFDERFFLYNEDVDLCLRLKRLGWRLLFVPGMESVHTLGGATGSRSRSALYLENLTRTRLRPFRPTAYRLYLAAIHTGWSFIRALSILCRGEPQAREKARALLRGHTIALRSVFDK